MLCGAHTHTPHRTAPHHTTPNEDDVDDNNEIKEAPVNETPFCEIPFNDTVECCMRVCVTNCVVFFVGGVFSARGGRKETVCLQIDCIFILFSSHRQTFPATISLKLSLSNEFCGLDFLRKMYTLLRVMLLLTLACLQSS